MNMWNKKEKQEQDISPADGEVGAEESSGEANDIESLKEDAACARQEAADSHDRYLRVCAEFDNYKKRAQRQMDDHKKFSNTALIKDLLPVVDNLERALATSGGNQSTTDACMAEGVEMTLSEIKNILAKYNVTPIESLGEPFDPNYHDAMMQAESEDYPENTVIQELQKGYMLHDRVIRPAMVVVSKGPSK